MAVPLYWSWSFVPGHRLPPPCSQFNSRLLSVSGLSQHLHISSEYRGTTLTVRTVPSEQAIGPQGTHPAISLHLWCSVALVLGKATYKASPSTSQLPLAIRAQRSWDHSFLFLFASPLTLECSLNRERKTGCEHSNSLAQLVSFSPQFATSKRMACSLPPFLQYRLTCF